MDAGSEETGAFERLLEVTRGLRLAQTRQQLTLHHPDHGEPIAVNSRFRVT